MTEATAAMGLFRGPDLIVEGCNDELRRITGCDPVGFPAREVWIGEVAKSVIAVMSEVFRTGERRHHWATWLEVPGSILIVPVARMAEPWGVATSWEPVPSPLVGRTPRASGPGLPAILLDELLGARRESEQVA